MGEPLIECVPNFSEGRNKDIIDAIINSITQVDGVSLLDVDMGADFNRTVVTMVGKPEAVLKAAIKSTGVALDLIDMTKHSGEHARMGAVDVVPFIPLSNSSMDDCVSLSERYAKSVSDKFGIPIYLYAESARKESRVKLPDIRKGEYEGLKQKLSKPEWKPDFGPSDFIPRSGVTATGARQVLIAFNVNLNTNDKSLANIIAGKIRTSGVIMRDENGNKIVDSRGNILRKSGKFKALQAAGWMYDDDTAQVSMNLLDHTTTGLHDVFDAIRLEANKLELEVTSSELVGLVPMQAMIQAGNHYSPNSEESNENKILQHAVDGLCLDGLQDFDVSASVIELAVRRNEH
jgi:glutamate formiminotransferase/formiminotetrahydrofolate cyclodeaminase|tara:strand:- start:4977 stop:6017 length:1041 start_codon:yes stop_codon:yes gene_type:complete